MQKLIYWVGVYSICVGIHEGLSIWARKIEKEQHKAHSNHEVKGPIGITAEPNLKPRNKIGFEIN
jgi:hypothetical protein